MHVCFDNGLFYPAGSAVSPIAWPVIICVLGADSDTWVNIISAVIMKRQDFSPDSTLLSVLLKDKMLRRVRGCKRARVRVCGQLGSWIWAVDSWVRQMMSLSHHYREMSAKDECVFVHVICWRWEGGFQPALPSATHSVSVWGVHAHAHVHGRFGGAVEAQGHKLTTLTDDIFIQLFQKTVCVCYWCVCVGFRVISAPRHFGPDSKRVG